MFRKVKKKPGVELTKRIRNNQSEEQDDSDQEQQSSALKAHANAKKKFKGLSADELEQIVQVSAAETVPVYQQSLQKGLIIEPIIEGPKRHIPKDMEEYIQQRMVEEKSKLINIQTQHGLINPSTLLEHRENQTIESQKESTGGKPQLTLEEQLYVLPEHLNVDKLVGNREIIDKPIQWTAGMMEIPVDPASKIETVE